MASSLKDLDLLEPPLPLDLLHSLDLDRDLVLDMLRFLKGPWIYSCTQTLIQTAKSSWSRNQTAPDSYKKSETDEVQGQQNKISG